MEKSMLLETIGDTMENRIIDFLIEGRGIEYTKKEIADGCEISRPTLYKILPQLISEKILKTTRKVGRITFYTIDETNPRVSALIKLEEILLKESFDGLENSKITNPA